MGTHEKKYVANVIGEEYWNWEATDKIFITAPTGSGKTFFVLRNLIKRAIKNREKIVYFVNRKILKKQLEKEINDIYAEMIRTGHENADMLNGIITLMTYQQLEIMISKISAKDVHNLMINWKSEYKIAVFDECHYFYADSNFNTFTELSYDFLTHCFQYNIEVFMSATIGKVEKLNKECTIRYLMKNPKYPNLEIQPFIEAPQILSHVRQYNADIDYSYIKIKVFRNDDDIEQVIKHGILNQNEKWLVFVDSKEYGKILEKNLSSAADSGNKISKDDIVYIDTDYKNDEEANNSVIQLSEEKYINKKVVITTAVMDNGISFHDKSLRNIVIMADTEEEFIQMLGRKRKDEHELVVYICQRDKTYFTKRRQSIEAKVDAYIRCRKSLDNLYKVNSIRIKNYCDTETISLYYGPFGVYRSIIETEGNFSQLANYPVFQQEVLLEILRNGKIRHNISSFMYAYQGLLACNRFSGNKLLDLRAFYQEMENLMVTDEFAFVKKQMQWLGKGLQDAEVVLLETEMETKNRTRERVDAVLNKYAGIKLDVNEIVDVKLKIRKHLKYLLTLQNGFTEKEIRDFPRTDRGMTPECFGKFMGILDLPYRLLKPDGSHYVIERYDKKK